MKPRPFYTSAFLFTFSVLFVCRTEGGSATWNSNPVSTDWRVAANWMPETVPNSASDVATFSTSALPQVELFGKNGTPLVETVAEVNFMPGASAYTITAQPFGALSFIGTGVVNDSGIQQNLKTETEDGSLGVGQFFFAHGASAGSSLNTFTNGQTVSFGGSGGAGGACQFNEDSTAGNATFVNEGGSRLQAGGGETNFYFSSATAGNATIINGGATAEGSTGGQVLFDSGTAGQCVIVNNGAENNGSGGRVFFTGGVGGSAQITNNGGTVSGAGGGTVRFSSLRSDAGTATIINNGGTVGGAHGAVTSFVDSTSAGQAVLVANGGTNGGEGGQIVLGENARARDAHFEVYGNGSLDVSTRVGGLKLGTLEGDGLVFLGTRNLKLGGNNIDVSFAGTIMDGGIAGGVGGALTKLGCGVLELNGMNTYSGGTTVKSGTLRVTNTTGSGTGTGPVTVEGALLGGFGVIGGPVTLGTSSGSSATIAPSNGRPKSAVLTIQGALTFNSASTYKWTVNNSKARADELVADGATISAGAVFSANTIGNGVLDLATVFTAINNTSVTPISGTFANLADGATISVGGTNFQASYEGGDGNDLTLTVVP